MSEEELRFLAKFPLRLGIGEIPVAYHGGILCLWTGDSGATRDRKLAHVRRGLAFTKAFETRDLVYVAQSIPTGLVKIGVSRNWRDRLRQLRTAHPFRSCSECSLPGERVNPTRHASGASREVRP